MVASETVGTKNLIRLIMADSFRVNLRIPKLLLRSRSTFGWRFDGVSSDLLGIGDFLGRAIDKSLFSLRIRSMQLSI